MLGLNLIRKGFARRREWCRDCVWIRERCICAALELKFVEFFRCGV